MSDRLAVLLTDRAKAWDKMNELREAIGQRQATTEERTEWARIEADLDAFTGDIDAEKRNTARASKFAEIDEAIGKELPPVKEDGVDEKRYAKIYDSYIRTGLGDGSRLNGEEKRILASRYETRAQAEGTVAAGGYLVPQGYLDKLTETMKWFGGFMAQANIIHTASGQPLPWPSNNDTGNLGSLLGENVQVTEVDVTLGQQQLSAWTYTSNLVLVSIQLLNDSAFDLNTWLPKKLGQRLGRAVANHLVNGTGTAQPLGIAVAPAVGATGATGSTLNVGYTNIVDLIHSVDAAYRQMGNCKFLMNDLTVAVLRKLVDNQGRPLWSPSMVQGLLGPEPDTFLGYPIVVDNAVPVMAANAKSILFGDFEQAYIVRQVLDVTIMRLVERYADFLQVGFFGFQRIDGRPDDAAAVKAYVNSAT